MDQGGQESVGDLIRGYRMDAGLTQEQLADAAGYGGWQQHCGWMGTMLRR
jgi:transcriptional regulator with XRE-family HTH domain